MALTADPTLATTALKGINAGTYPITPSVGTLTAANYSFSYVPGILTVPREGARIEYTGDTLVSTGSTSTSSTTKVWMGAAVAEDPDGSLGSRLGGQQVKFTLYASNVGDPAHLNLLRAAH